MYEILSYQQSPITVSFDNQVLVNANQMASAFGKDLSELNFNPDPTSFVPPAIAAPWHHLSGYWIDLEAALQFADTISALFKNWLQSKIAELSNTYSDYLIAA